MENLNAEQIKKALECCIKDNTCEQCPLSPFTCHIQEDALALIKELTEDVKRVTKQCGEIIVECDERDAERLRELADLEAIAEQYRKQFEDCAEDRAKLTEENERLRAEVSVKKKLLDKCVDLEDNVRADTVRKMQERLKAQKFTHKNFGELVYVDDIDQIAKGMVKGL